ncbi:hypothetical protein BBBOND_0302620 [Babesia bigemina]|uniref:Uncharacterized protein n=1 Tax=Babesia bigemina TaxID=5866 RepID=A0A061D754_BABBI|nr:hypothetical protein BBBOND_0302620 [Babesia bigemina]CDR96358.1 hypothetical protein BBBOND_0302620 [Babesia bigemina]|eukprot:XP_012768544.1 hypothetical protein BBBOND_0302620 [Babesia bigemina]
MVYTSLTEAPHNLKEGIDWLMALKGSCGESTLKAMAGAIHHLFSKHSDGYKQLPALEKMKSISREFLEKPELRDNLFVKQLLSRFYTPASTANTGFKHLLARYSEEYARVVGVKGARPEYIEESLRNVMDGFGKLLNDIKNPDKYKSAYSAEATWEASCAKDPEACAVVLVGMAPMLYAGMQSLSNAVFSKSGWWSTTVEYKAAGDVLRPLGYEESECRAGMNGSYIYETFKGLDADLFHKTYDLAGFDIFYGSDIVQKLPVKQPVVEEALVAETAVDPVQAAKSAKTRKPGQSGRRRKAAE